MQFNGSCAMRFGHCTNLSISNVHITNIKDAHHIEAAAVDTLSITDCTFEKTLRYTGNSCEAIQLDILHDSKHFPGFEELSTAYCSISSHLSYSSFVSPGISRAVLILAGSDFINLKSSGVVILYRLNPWHSAMRKALKFIFVP